MNKKVTVIGKGSVGSIAILQLLKLTEWDIDWVFDEEIPVASVGEASNLRLPLVLARNDFNQNFLREIGGTNKTGILKENWSWNDNFFHPFLIHDVAMHFSALQLHEGIFKKVKNNPRINIINKNVENPQDLDSDFVLVCSGAPKELKAEDYILIEEVPVNAVYVVQCYWDYPAFNYSLTNAMKYGWVFGIPLIDRISIGYLYNSNINTLEEIKEDIKNIFQQYNLNPSNTVNHLNFQSYYKTNNFNGKVVYNGNNSFFIEPLEATSIGFSIVNTLEAIEYWEDEDKTYKYFQDFYIENISNISAMISLHYLAGSKYDTEFWKNAELKAKEKITKEFKNNSKWSDFIWKVIMDQDLPEDEIGTWGAINYRMNIEGLGIKEKLIKIRNSTKSISFDKEKK